MVKKTVGRSVSFNFVWRLHGEKDGHEWNEILQKLTKQNSWNPH